MKFNKNLDQRKRIKTDQKKLRLVGEVKENRYIFEKRMLFCRLN